MWDNIYKIKIKSMKYELFCCNDNKCRYIYKIIIVPTGQYYYGQHTVDFSLIEFDNYMGSGSDLQQIYELSGIAIAKKEICCYAESMDELNILEKQYIGTKYKDDELCLNKVPGGYYKRDDDLKHDVAILGGKALSQKLHTDLNFAKEYKEHQKQKWLEFKSDVNRYQTMLEKRAQKIKQHNKQFGIKISAGNAKGEDNAKYNKIRIYNDELHIGKFINRDDILPPGWRYGSKRKHISNNKLDQIAPCLPPGIKNKIKYLNILDFSDVYLDKSEIAPLYLVKVSKTSKDCVYVINIKTKKRKRVPKNIKLPLDWQYTKYSKRN